MKFGEYLRSQKVQEWQHAYLDYDSLKQMIKTLEEIHLSVAQAAGEKGTSLSIPRPTNAAAMPVGQKDMTQEKFYAFLEQEMRKIEQFTKKQVHFLYLVTPILESFPLSCVHVHLFVH